MQMLQKKKNWLAKPWTVGGYSSEDTDCLLQAPAQSAQAGARAEVDSPVAAPAIGRQQGVEDLVSSQVNVPQQS